MERMQTIATTYIETCLYLEIYSISLRLLMLNMESNWFLKIRTMLLCKLCFSSQMNFKRI